MISFLVDLPLFDQARCADVKDKDFFFPDGRSIEAERLPQLQAICRSCIHEKECLAYALRKQIVLGFWGGSTAQQRVDELKKHQVITFTGISAMIVELHKQGLSVKQIVAQLKTSKSYAIGVLRKLAASEQGANQLHQHTKDLSKGLG